MKIYNNKSWKLNQIKETWFKLEKEMQNLTETNLEEIFWLEFINTEFQLNNLRIDTLAFDNESNSFVIIEYKRWNSYSVIDQWMTYLALMLNNKADFVQELWKKKNKFIDVKSIDWSQSKVIIIADNFNKFQKESINFKDLPIELWEMKNFDNWNVVFNPIKASNTTESIKTVTKFETKEFEKVNKEIKTYDELFHTNWKSEKILELYEKIKQYILWLDENFEIAFKKMYIAFKKDNKNIISLKIFVNSINIYLHWKYWLISDENKLTRNIKEIWHHCWNAETEIKVSNDGNMHYVFDLIKQTYLLNK